MVGRFRSKIFFSGFAAHRCMGPHLNWPTSAFGTGPSHCPRLVLTTTTGHRVGYHLNFSFPNLVFIFRCSSSTTNPVYERRVNLLVCSLPLHRHSYTGFILVFASSIHNKQQSRWLPCRVEHRLKEVRPQKVVRWSSPVKTRRGHRYWYSSPWTPGHITWYRGGSRTVRYPGESVCC
jgi:hypothetical protein